MRTTDGRADLGDDACRSPRNLSAADQPWYRHLSIKAGATSAQALSTLFSRFLDARGTTTWLAIVTAMELVLARGSHRLNTALLLSSSTNLHNLRTDPINVLATSAFFVASFRDYVEFALACLVILAPLENTIGFGRWLIGLLVGHVGATLLVAIALSASILDAGERPTRVIDVGVSYGLATLAAIYVYALHGWQRWCLAGLLTALVGAGMVTSGQFSDWGHLAACLLGFAIGPILVRPRPIFSCQDSVAK